MRILLSGGGTMGSVSPLIAVYEKIKKINPTGEFLFVGTIDGPEKKAVQSYKIPFQAITSGKFRRYFSWQNFYSPILVIFGFCQSFLIILKFRPNAVMVAGSFVGVPVAWAAWLLRVPVLIHQQDVIAGLANKLMANAAKKITVSFELSLKDFNASKTVLIGNPVRQEFYACEPQKGKKIFSLKEDLPVVLILGGGTGALKINQIVEQSIGDLLTFCQVIHLTGRGKKTSIKMENYQQFEFLTHEMTEALCAADLVISRAGMSTLSELIVLAKPVILIPIASSHQEFNAQYFQKDNAVKVLSEESLNSEIFVSAIKELIFDKAKRENLISNIAKMMKIDGAQNAAELLLKIARK